MTVDKVKLKALAERLMVEHDGGTSDPIPAIQVTAPDVLAMLAEVEALSKDLESHKRMLLSSAVNIGAIGEALGAEMDDDPSELEGLAVELRKDADRFRFVIDCPIRTMVALSRKAHEDDFDLGSECDRLMSKIASKKTGD